MFSLWQYCKDGLTKHNQAWVMHWWSSDVFFVTIFMLPKRRFWKAEQTFQRSFSTHFSTFRRPNSVLTPLKSVSKMTSEMFVLLPKSSFGKDNIARMGLQNTTNMRYALMIVWCFLCNNIARRITRAVPLGGRSAAPAAPSWWGGSGISVRPPSPQVGRSRRMGLQNTTNMRDALMIVWCFLCNNIARMGLQNTTNMRDAWWSSNLMFSL